MLPYKGLVVTGSEGVMNQFMLKCHGRVGAESLSGSRNHASLEPVQTLRISKATIVNLFTNLSRFPFFLQFVKDKPDY